MQALQAHGAKFLGKLGQGARQIGGAKPRLQLEGRLEGGVEAVVCRLPGEFGPGLRGKAWRRGLGDVLAGKGVPPQQGCGKAVQERAGGGCKVDGMAGLVWHGWRLV